MRREIKRLLTISKFGAFVGRFQSAGVASMAGSERVNTAHTPVNDSFHKLTAYTSCGTELLQYPLLSLVATYITSKMKTCSTGFRNRFLLNVIIPIKDVEQKLRMLLITICSCNTLKLRPRGKLMSLRYDPQNLCYKI